MVLRANAPLQFSVQELKVVAPVRSSHASSICSMGGVSAVVVLLEVVWVMVVMFARVMGRWMKISAWGVVAMRW